MKQVWVVQRVVSGQHPTLEYIANSEQVAKQFVDEVLALPENTRYSWTNFVVVAWDVAGKVVADDLEEDTDAEKAARAQDLVEDTGSSDVARRTAVEGEPLNNAPVDAHQLRTAVLGTRGGAKRAVKKEK